MRKTLQVSNRWRELTQSKTWSDLLKEAARQWPDREALVFGEQRVSYAEYQENTKRVAKGLYAIGIRPGDHVALWMTNRVEWSYCRFGIYQLGAVMIPVSTRYRTEDLDYILKQSDAKVLIMENVFLGKINATDMLGAVCPELASFEPGELKSTKYPLLRSVICLGGEQAGCFSWEDILRAGEGVSDKDIEVELRPDDLIHIIYTSGTTGFPKGVMTPNTNQIAYSAITAEAFNLQEGNRYLNLPPFFGNIGLWSMNLCIITGATLVITDRFRPLDALNLIEQEKITHTMFVPTMLGDVLSHPDLAKFDLSSLKYIHSGGAYLPTKLILEAKEKFGITINNAYGLVEASGLDTWVPMGDTEEHVQRTIGVAMPHAEVTIRDPNTNEELPPGKEGEICMKEVFPGSCHMKGYYKQPELTSQTIVDGWLHSGDLGVMDEEGYFTITGRVKEMFTVGGFNVSPPEIEEFLRKYPKVQDVAVVGVPDERLGEVGAAYIRLKEGEAATEEEIINLCKEKLADIKVPRYVFFVEEFPLNPQAKVQKFKLREQFIKERGIEEKK